MENSQSDIRPKEPQKPVGTVAFFVVCIVSGFVLGTIFGSLGLANAIASSKAEVPKADVQIVDWSVLNVSGQKYITVKVSNLGNAIGGARINCTLTQELSNGTVNSRELYAEKSVKLAPAETLTITSTIGLAWSPYQYSFNNGMDYYNSPGASAIPAFEIVNCVIEPA